MNEEPLKYFTECGLHAGVYFVVYFSDDGLRHCNESLTEFYPDDYWSWPKR